jgi:DNA-binding Xre family transcriptional regulator
MNVDDTEINTLWTEFSVELAKLSRQVSLGMEQLEKSSDSISTATISLLENMCDSVRGIETAAEVAVENLAEFARICAELDCEMEKVDRVEKWIKDMKLFCGKLEKAVEAKKKKKHGN